MSVDSLPSPVSPPTTAQLLEILRRQLPPGFYEQLETHDSFALFRAIASMWAALAEEGNKLIAAKFYLPHALERDIPASSGIRATANVTLTRNNIDTQPALVILPGQLKLVGPSERIYRNVDSIVWNPFDVGERVVQFECEVAGFVGNLEFVANADGTVDLDLVEFQDQDRNRTATGGSIVAGASPLLYDSGVPDVFDPADVGLYVEIISSSNPSNIGKIRRIEGYSWPAVESPPGTGRYPGFVFLDSNPRDNCSEVLVEDESAVTFTDYTAEAISETENDIDIFPATLAADDAIYFSHTSQFDSVIVSVDTAGAGDWGDLIWEYWDGAAWSAFSGLTDATGNWLLAGDVYASWTVPGDWDVLTSPGGSGLDLYFARARVPSVTSVTTIPLAGRVVVTIPDPLNDDSGSVTWKLRDFEDLGVEITECEAFSGGRDNDLWVLGDERGVYQQNDETDDTFRQRAARLLDVVSPAAIKRAIDRILSPYGYRGDAIDVQDGLGAIFMDADFLDYYTPGDDFPTDPWKLGLSLNEAYGFFLVLLPYLSLGEFGSAFDEGPITELPDGSFLDSAVDYGVFDGYPVSANAVYASIYSTISKIKAGGILFDMTRTEDLSVISC